MKKIRKECNFKTLSAAILTGCAIVGMGNTVQAADLSEIDLSQKPVETPTLDYLKDNNILIPQKGEYNSTDKTWVEADSVQSSGSAYTITEGAADDYTFEYKTADKDGNLVSSYYKIDLNAPIVNFSTNKIDEHISWEEVSEAGNNTVEVNLHGSNGGVETKYYKYTYTPKNYTQVTTRVSDITSEKVNNVYFDNVAGAVVGGALYNSSDKSNVDINADFIYNHTLNDTGSKGAAIYNNNKLGNINGNFINNYISGKYVKNGDGAVVYNEGGGVIGNITGNFIENRVEATTGHAQGGVVYNYNSKVGDIEGNFVGNYTTGTQSYGGAIFNIGKTSPQAVINDISGMFVSNYSEGNKHKAYGGAIYNGGTINSINGVFIDNHTSSNSAPVVSDRQTLPAAGGALANISGVLKDLNAHFIGNYAISKNTTDYYIEGGALLNDNKGNISNIKGDFIGNYVSGCNCDGGAIANIYNSNIGNITGDFIGNTAISNSTNSAMNNSGHAQGGAIYNFNNSTIGNIKGNFIDNHVKGQNAHGGAILNINGNKGDATIESIEGNFIGNTASSGINKAQGGAIANYGKIGDIKGYFAENEVVAGIHGDGGAIYNSKKCSIGNITGNFINNVARSRDNAGHGEGAGVYNWAGKIGDIKGDFINNYVTGKKAYGAAIFNMDDVATGEKGEIADISGNFINNRSEAVIDVAQGGAIYNDSKVGNISGSFVNNYAKSEAGTAHGGAIFTKTDMNFVADGSVNVFKGNYTEANGVKDDNAIWVEKANDNTLPALTFKTENNGRFVMHDNINGTQGYAVNITGDGTGTFELYNDIHNSQLNIGNNNLITLNNDTHTYNVEKLTVTGDINMSADVSLADKTMDRFAAKEYGEHTGKLNVSALNYVNSTKIPTDVKIEVLFADNGLKDNVTESLGGQTILTPIFKYGVSYDNRKDGGYFVFNRGGSAGGNPSNAFNPAILASPVSTIAASQSTINETFKHVFEHVDSFTQLPFNERMSMMNQNKYAITDFNSNIPYNALKNSAGWFRPYVTFENINLKNGPKVGAITYGSLAGFDTDFYEHKNGWHSVGTGYIGYNGSNMNYTGVDINANGGILGYTHTMYKGNFWSALTVNAGATTGQIRTMYGKDDFTSLLAGVGSKTGYNFEFKEGKFIFQPIMFMSYSFVNTFDYTNAGGVRIDNKPAHSIQLNPSMRFIANTKNGWQPYAQVGMVWNVLNSSDAFANNIKLPSMSVKPYIEYGLGIQRTWKDYFTAFGQVMMRNGGRNGVAMTGGIRWALGRDNNTEKVQNNTQKKVVKQLTPEPKVALGKQYNTTRTTSAAVLKQL